MCSRFIHYLSSSLHLNAFALISFDHEKDNTMYKKIYRAIHPDNEQAVNKI